MVMGDLVLLETEINPVMTALIQNGMEITAIHNHVPAPATFYMHVGGHGEPEKMATAILKARRRSRLPRPLRPSPPSISTRHSLSRSSLRRPLRRWVERARCGGHRYWSPSTPTGFLGIREWSLFGPGRG